MKGFAKVLETGAADSKTWKWFSKYNTTSRTLMEIESMEVTGIPQNPFKSQEIIEVHEISRNPAPAGSARILRKLETPH